MRLKAQLDLPSEERLYLAALLRGGQKVIWNLLFASLNVAYTVKSEEQGERLERICGSCPTVCFLRNVYNRPTHMVRSAVCFKDCIAPVFHCFKTRHF